MISGFLLGNSGPQTDGYLSSEKYPLRFDGFLQGNNGPQNDGYLRKRIWAFDAPVVEIGGGGPTSGAVNATLAGATQGATGTVKIAAAVAATLSGATQASTGRLPINAVV